MDFIKQNIKPNFKEFNDEWARAGNYSYSVQFRDKAKAKNLETYFRGLGFKERASECYWDHKLRKNFNLKICPRQKYFYRITKVISVPSRYKNVYEGHYFDDFCFKFIITEKVKK